MRLAYLVRTDENSGDSLFVFFTITLTTISLVILEKILLYLHRANTYKITARTIIIALLPYDKEKRLHFKCHSRISKECYILLKSRNEYVPCKSTIFRVLSN